MPMDKDNQGALFRNKKKETERHPDHTGQATVDGVEYWISAWVNTSKKTDERYFSLRFKRKDQDSYSSQPARTEEPGEVVDDIPF